MVKIDYTKEIDQQRTGTPVYTTEILEAYRNDIRDLLKSVGGYTLWSGTRAEYDAITTKDANTIYFIEE